jgi:hypothetical protein
VLRQTCGYLSIPQLHRVTSTNGHSVLPATRPGHAMCRLRGMRNGPRRDSNPPVTLTEHRAAITLQAHATTLAGTRQTQWWCDTTRPRKSQYVTEAAERNLNIVVKRKLIRMRPQPDRIHLFLSLVLDKRFQDSFREHIAF